MWPQPARLSPSANKMQQVTCSDITIEPASNATSGRLCHDATRGSVTVSFADGDERAMLLRVGGPHPQTLLFVRIAEKSAYGAMWVAHFRLCEAGRYSASVLLVTRCGARLSATARRNACPTFHTPQGSVLQRPYEWVLATQSKLNYVSCAGGMWRWQQTHPHRDHRDGYEPGKANALRAAAAACRGSWRVGEECEARNRSLARNLSPSSADAGAPASASADAHRSAARASLTTVKLLGVSDRGRFTPRHTLGGALEDTYAHLEWRPANTSAREQQRLLRCGGCWRAALPPGGCACLMGDSSTRELFNRLVQRWSAECHQVEIHKSKGLCASGGALAQVWVRFGLESFLRVPPSNATPFELLHTQFTMHEMGAPPDGGTGGDAAAASNTPPSWGGAVCERCAVVIANIGRWPLGVTKPSNGGNPGHLPWTANKYTTAIESLTRWLAALRGASSLPVALMSTNPMPLHAKGSQTSCPPVNSEYPHVVNAFNQLARAAAEQHGVGYIDTFSISRDVLELSWDGAHYADPVSLGIALEVEQWLAAALGGSGAQRTQRTQRTSGQ